MTQFHTPLFEPRSLRPVPLALGLAGAGVVVTVFAAPILGALVTAIGLLAAAVAHIRGARLLSAELAAQNLEARTTSLILQSLTDGVLVIDAARRIVRINDAACEMMGVSQEESLGKPPGAGLASFVDPLGKPMRDSGLPSARAMGGEEEVDGELVGVDRPDGSRVWANISTRLVNAEGGQRMLVVVANDVTSQISASKATEAETAQLRHRALHDSLTGLPNRTMLMDRLSHATQNANRRGAGTGLIVVDLDGFKAVNDTLGHAAGDEVLVQVAVRLRTALRASDTAARLGGDEFVVLCEDLNPGMADLELTRIAERIQALLNQPYITTLGPADVGASLGWAVAGPDDDLTLELVTQADEAMLTDKRQRKRVRTSRMRKVHAPMPEPAEKTLSVYIVDDDPAMRLLASRIIDANPANGLTVVGESADGDQAIGEIIARRPDLVLCDVMMPGVSGPEVVTAVRELNPEQRMIFWSATTAPELERYERELGVPYVLKDRIEELPVALMEAADQASAWKPDAIPQG